MDDLILKVNWLATLLGAALAHLVGWAWYSQTFFGSRWAAGLGIKYDRKMPVVLMMQQLAGLLLVSWFVAASVAAECLCCLFSALLVSVFRTMLGRDLLAIPVPSN